MNGGHERLEYYEDKYGTLRDVTLCYPIDNVSNRVLIAMKKRGFGEGKWNGVGGKLKEGESIEDALKRETEEEIGIRIRDYRKIAELKFFFENNEGWNQKVHVFVTDSWEGEPSESEEMKPKWFEKGKLPLEGMWPDDKYWLNGVLSGKKVRASFLFNGNEEITDYRIEEVREL